MLILYSFFCHIYSDVFIYGVQSPASPKQCTHVRLICTEPNSNQRSLNVREVQEPAQLDQEMDVINRV